MCRLSNWSVFFVIILIFVYSNMIHSQTLQDFQVNDNSESSDQIMPRIATDGYNNFIVVWQDNRYGNWDIYSQRYNYSGTKQGNNIKINEDPGYGNQYSPTVAIDNNGDFAIVWRDDSDQSIYGQRYSSNGTKLGNNFKISETSVPSYENHPAIAMDINGNFVVAWHDFNLLINCQRYNNEGIKQGNNFLVDGSGVNQYYPDIVMDENGNFIVAWGDNRDYRANDIYCRMFNYDGTNMSTSFLVSDPLPAYQSDPRIAIDGNSNFIVVWEDTRNEPSWNFGDVYGQRISSNGALIGSNFKVNDNTDFSYQAGAAIAVNRDENCFVVAWDDYRHGWDDIDVYTRFFTSDGQATQPGFRINQDNGKNIQNSVDVKWVNNRVYFVWTDNRIAGQGKDIFAQIEVFNSEPVANAGENQTIEGTSKNGAQITLDGSCSSDSDGDQLVYTWQENDLTVSGPTTDPISHILLSLGTHTIKLTVSDGKGGTDSDEVIINVVDTTPPTLTVAVSPNVLWPPNHKMVNIQAQVTVNDVCDPEPAMILLSIVSNEPDNGKGDGGQANDIQGAEFCTLDLNFQLRAERSGKGDGRIYTVTYSVIDVSGNYVSVSDTVSVPHNMGKILITGDNSLAPEDYALIQNYPNPFNPATEINFQLPEASHVVLKIFNSIGKEIITIMDGYYEVGYHKVRWDGKDYYGNPVSSGIYLCQLQAGSFSQIRKMSLIR